MICCNECLYADECYTPSRCSVREYCIEIGEHRWVEEKAAHDGYEEYLKDQGE